MLPGSHAIPTNDSALDPLLSSGLLADAFSEFISASSLLEASYRDLQREVRHLGSELSERNAALTRSLAENDRMRAALQQIIDSMPCGVLVLDTAETIVMINPEGRRLLELGAVHVTNLHTLSAISQIDFESLVAGAGDRLDSELSISSAAGKRWLAIGNRKLSCAPASHEPGKGRTTLKSIWILRDITASKRAEQEREAARSAMALAEVSTALAHEIRNPLASMELFAGLLMEDREQASLWVSHLRAGIRLLSATVNNVLSLQGGGGSAPLGPIELSACVRAGVEFVRPIAEQAGVALSFVGDGELRIQGNENQLRQILLNLISNAIRHTSDGGKVTVTARGTLRDERICGVVEVSDTGCGIPEQQIDRIFEVGFSAQGDTPGLGLAVCRRLVEGLGGTIRATSRIHRGSTFEMEFAAI